jgi:hypothetical protein
LEAAIDMQTADIAALRTDVTAVQAAQTAVTNSIASLEATVTGLSMAITAQVIMIINSTPKVWCCDKK